MFIICISLSFFKSVLIFRLLRGLLKNCVQVLWEGRCSEKLCSLWNFLTSSSCFMEFSKNITFSYGRLARCFSFFHFTRPVSSHSVRTVSLLVLFSELKHRQFVPWKLMSIVRSNFVRPFEVESSLSSLTPSANFSFWIPQKSVLWR